MVSITVEGKTYELKRRMSRYELKQVESYGKKYGELEELVKSNPEKAVQLIQSTTSEDEEMIDRIVSVCLGISQESVFKEMEFVHEVLLFGEIIKASVPGDAHFLQSAKPSTATT